MGFNIFYQRLKQSRKFLIFSGIFWLLVFIFTIFFSTLFAQLGFKSVWIFLLEILIFSFLFSFPISLFLIEDNTLGKLKINHRQIIILIVLISFILIFLYSAIVTYKQNNFLTGYDLAIFDQAIWHLSKFEIPESSIRNVPVVFGDHFHPIISFLTPLYWIWSNPKILLIAQIIILILGVLPLYFICKHFKINPLFTLLISLLYLLNPALERGAIADFHEIIFAPVLFLSSFYFLIKKGWLYFIFFLLLLIFTKETLALFLIGYGIFLLFYERSKKIGFATILIGVLSFFLIISYIIPTLNSLQLGYSYFPEYPGFKNGLIRGILNTLKNPFPLLTNLIYPLDKWFGASLFLTFFIFNFFLSPFLFFLFLPLLIERFSNYTLFWGVETWHNVLFVPIGIVGIIISFEKIKDWQIKKRFSNEFLLFFRNLVLIFPFIAVLFWFLQSSYIFVLPHALQKTNGELIQIEEANNIIKLIPKSAAVATSEPFLPHLSHRKDIYLLPRISNAEYVLLHKVSFLRKTWPLTISQQKELLIYLKNHPDFEIIAEGQSAILFKRTTPFNERLKNELAEICSHFIEENSTLMLVHKKYLLNNCYF
jgi:uncharacterized membrane protein